MVSTPGLPLGNTVFESCSRLHIFFFHCQPSGPWPTFQSFEQSEGEYNTVLSLFVVSISCGAGGLGGIPPVWRFCIGVNTLFKKVMAILIIGSLLVLPVLADDEVVESEGSNVEDSNMESDSGDDSVTVVNVDVHLDELVPYLNQISDNQEQFKEWASERYEESKEDKNISNNNLVFLTGCIISFAGLLIGYYTGKDLLDFLW